VRDCLADIAGEADRPVVLVAVSGGPDSLALLHAACFVGPRAGVHVGAVTVDHGLQEGSLGRARDVAAAASRLGATPVSIWHVQVGTQGGPEAAARAARRAALEAAARAAGARAVLLAHTRDDQAETVLLGLARGSGARSLSGMAPRAGLMRRPLLHLPRRIVVEAARAEAASVWDDPHNVDPRYARARVRARVLPVLELELGPGVAAALARTADLLRADADALDDWAAREAATHIGPDGALDVVGLDALPEAVRTRVLRTAALAAGAPASDLTAGHVTALDRLVRDAPSGATIDLPGAVRAVRHGSALYLTPRASRAADAAPQVDPGGTS